MITAIVLAFIAGLVMVPLTWRRGWPVWAIVLTAFALGLLIGEVTRWLGLP